MEGDASAKAPVTRLRKRLSVESEDSGSPHPSAPSTPTKRRGRLAAKPQLDLIEENATPTITPKKNTKTVAAKEREGQNEEKTPSRRSTRIKSNVSEVSEEKTATPSKRNTKIKSNSSLLSDSIVAESPRALRAARRLSQTGSDNEASSTPLKRTRRNRKDSTSSIENQAENVKVEISKTAVEVIVEESGINTLNNSQTSEGDNTSPGSIRKSTRLLQKTSKQFNTSNVDDKIDEINNKLKQSENHEQQTPDAMKLDTTDDNIHIVDEKGVISDEQIDYKTVKNDSTKLDTKVDNNTKDHMNHSSTLTASNTFTQNRQRTLSWNNQQTSSSSDSIFYNDNEGVKKKKKKKEESLNVAPPSSEPLNKDDKLEDVRLNSPTIINTSPDSNKRFTGFETTNTLNATEKFMEKSPGKTILSTVFIEDLDTDRAETISLDKNFEDQCVPVVESDINNQETSPNPKINPVKSIETDNSFNKSNKLIDIFAPKSIGTAQLLSNDSCEPMDIDETMPANISLDDRRSLLTSQQCEKENVSSHSLNKSGNENKSTLILSQIKDNSSNDNNTTKSPKKPDESENLSKSYNFGETDKNLKDVKTRVSLIESVGTPSHKNLMKSAIQTSTPVTLSNKNEKRILESLHKSPNESKVKTTTKSETSDDESSAENDSILDNEAIDADDYESGDSQDEEEKQYVIENEILDKGETLSSDGDISNDSDYEKDSFVVSSNEEDDELLSGSGDNLSMSDNELSISKKSKEKYNARKEKERKQLSREMYEARHGLSDSNKKSNRPRLDSTKSESDEDCITVSKKRNRMRLDSSHDISNVTSDVEESIIEKKKKKKVKRLSESLCIENENEITNVCSQSVLNEKDPLSSTNMSMKNEPDTPKSKNSDVDIEEVQVEENVTLLKSNETHDPLGATMVDEESSLSENEQIKQNYNDILSELNKENNKPKKIKHHDISLNLNAKKKKTKETTIIDQLNITHTKKQIKKTEKVKNKISDDAKPKGQTVINNEELSSDSIDFKLLFNEDSSDGQDKVKNKISGDAKPKRQTVTNNEELSSDTIDFKLLFNEESSDGQHEQNTSVDFIPLKKSEAKTDIRLNSGDTLHNSSSSAEKKKKEKRASLENLEQSVTVIETNNDMADNISKSNKKKTEKHSDLTTDDTGVTAMDTIETNPDKTPKSDKKKKKKHVELITEGAEQNKTLDISATSNSSSKKKNKKLKEPTNEIVVEPENEIPADNTNMKEPTVDETEVEVTEEKPKSKKKKKISENIEEEIEVPTVVEADDMTVHKTKKKKKLSQSDISETEKIMDTPSETDNIKGRKKKKYQSRTDESEFTNDEQVPKISEEPDEPVVLKSKKRKRSLIVLPEEDENKLQDNLTPASLNESLGENKKKKQKLSNDTSTVIQNIDELLSDQFSKDPKDKTHKAGKKKNKNKVYNLEDNTNHDVEENKSTDLVVNQKRKIREDENPKQKSKVFKERALDKVHVPRLPESILTQLEEKPAKKLKQKSSFVSTTPFVVEEIIDKKNKPSNFLEESVYINNDSDRDRKGKKKLMKPKVLPTVPTAHVSDDGATTNFIIKTAPRETQFVAQSNFVNNFKNDYLYGKKIKRLGTYELYKRQRNVKLSKF